MINKTKLECETKLCHYDSATRTRFYNGMLLTAEHLRAEQAYHREALRRVVRNLFGSGIVCGLEVENQPRGFCVKIQPGVALDCCGNLIEVCKCVTVDLSKECKDKFGSNCNYPDSKDPDQYKITKYLVLRYDEKLSDPEPVMTSWDECKPASEKQNCEASKIREGYCIELWDECPCPEQYSEPEKTIVETLQERAGAKQSSLTGSLLPSINIQRSALNISQASQQNLAAQTPEGRKECYDLPLPCAACGCCENTNAVGLAKLVINCEQNTVDVDVCSCRRYVFSSRLSTWLFSRFQSKKYLSREMADVYPKLGYLPMAHLVATAVGFEEHSESIYTHNASLETQEKRIAALETQEKRIAALEAQGKRIATLDAQEKRIKVLENKAEKVSKEVDKLSKKPTT